MALKSRKNDTAIIHDMTQGNIPRLLFSFAVPLALSNALQAIYNIVDMVVVGQVLGGVGLSAVSTGGNILHILTFLSSGFAGAGQIIISRSIGAGNRDSVRRIIGTMFSLLFLIAAVVTCAALACRSWLLNIVNTPAEAYAGTMVYTVTTACGLLFNVGYFTVSSILRGMGDSKRPFLFVMIASVLNMVLDILFVGFLGMGVFGAALATVIGQAVSFIFAIVYLYCHRDSFGFDFRPASFIPDPAVVKRLASLGLPMALQMASISISQTVVCAWLNSYGVSYSAIAGILSKLNLMIGIITNAVSTAAASMVGQNLGARKYERVPSIILCAGIVGTLIAAVAALAYALFPQQVFSLFTTDGAVVSLAATVIGPFIVGMLGCATRVFGFSLINGSGRSRLNLTVALMDGVVGRIGIAYIMGFLLGMGPLGFWYGDAIAGNMVFVVAFVFYLTGRWKQDRPA